MPDEPRPPAESGQPRRRLWRRRLALAAVSGGLALSAAEVLARLRFGAPIAERLPVVQIEASPLRGWMMVAGDTHYTYQHRVELFSLGLRGPVLGERQEGEVRVLALGDSMTYGQGVADEETLPAYLERRLEELDPRQRPWTVINTGHRGYGTNQELGVLVELGERIEPDIVLLLWFWNDLTGRRIEEIHARYQRLGPVAQDVHAPMEGWTEARWHAVQLIRRSALLMTLHDVWRARERYPFERIGRQGLRRLDRDLRRFVTLCREHQARPVFAVIPDANHVRGPHPTGELEDAATDLARSHELPVVPLLQPLLEHFEATGQVPVLPYDGHYDAPGNRLMADYLASELLAQDLAHSTAR